MLEFSQQDQENIFLVYSAPKNFRVCCMPAYKIPLYLPTFSREMDQFDFFLELFLILRGPYYTLSFAFWRPHVDGGLGGGVKLLI